MKQEDRELLLKDLCARIPYGVKVATEYVINKPVTFKGISGDGSEYIIGGCFSTIDVLSFERWPCKPYLRLLDSMTEEEMLEINAMPTGKDWDLSNCSDFVWLPNPDMSDWLNRKHFDWRGLIPRGLAIAVTKENNPYRDKE